MTLPGPAGTGVMCPVLIRQLIQLMPGSELTHHGKAYKDLFKGSAGFTAIMEIYEIEQKEDAVDLGREL